MKPEIKKLQKRIEELEKEIAESMKKKKKPKKRENLIPSKVLYKWQAPERVFKKRDKPWFLKIAIIALLFILFFAFLQDFIAILVICVIVLISFLLGSITPRTVEHQILNKGVKSFDTLYKWDDLDNFQIADKAGYKILYITTKFKFPHRLTMLIGRKSEIPVVKLLGKKLDYREYEEKQGWISKMADGEMVNPEKYSHLFKYNKKKPKKKTSK